MGKKKTQRQQDFQKVKLKVGRKVLKAQNETKITVKAKQIVIKEQLKAKNHLQEATTRNRLTIPELLVHLAHYNPTMRYEGISGLSELLTRDSESVRNRRGGGRRRRRRRRRRKKKKKKRKRKRRKKRKMSSSCNRS